jgi:hypothetical protein
MKINSIILVLVFLFLSGTTVHAQNNQTGVKKEIVRHSEQTDSLQGKKIQQAALSTNGFEKLDTTKTVMPKSQKKKKTAQKKNKKQ